MISSVSQVTHSKKYSASSRVTEVRFLFGGVRKLALSDLRVFAPDYRKWVIVRRAAPSGRGALELVLGIPGPPFPVSH